MKLTVQANYFSEEAFKLLLMNKRQLTRLLHQVVPEQKQQTGLLCFTVRSDKRAPLEQYCLVHDLSSVRLLPIYIVFCAF